MISTAEKKKPLRSYGPTQGQRVSTGARTEQETSDSWSQLAPAPILPKRRPHQLPRQISVLSVRFALGPRVRALPSRPRTPSSSLPETSLQMLEDVL